MRSLKVTGVLLLCGGLVAACGSSATTAPATGGGVATTAPVASVTAAPSTVAPTDTLAASSTPQPSGTTPGSPSAFNACSLLTDAEATAVTTVSYGPGHAFTEQGVFECQWATTGMLDLAVNLEPDAASAKALYTTRQTYWRGATSPAHVPNADMAFLAGNVQARTGEIAVLHGTTFFELSFLNGTFPTAAQLLAAATLVTGRLP
jgi:hypothetical protein